MQANGTDQCVRLGFALVLIALVSFSLYQFSGRAGFESAMSPPVSLPH